MAEQEGLMDRALRKVPVLKAFYQAGDALKQANQPVQERLAQERKNKKLRTENKAVGLRPISRPTE